MALVICSVPKITADCAPTQVGVLQVAECYHHGRSQEKGRSTSAVYGQFDEAEPKAVRDGGGTEQNHYVGRRSLQRNVQTRLDTLGHWDIGKPDINFVRAVTTIPIGPCRTLEIGCGTGDNAIWLAQHGFPVVGIDASEIAIERAKEKAASANATCTFAVLDILKSHVENAPFGFAFDRGCFHAVGSDEERATFAKQVHRHLEDGDLWLSLMGMKNVSAPVLHSELPDRL